MSNHNRDEPMNAKTNRLSGPDQYALNRWIDDNKSALVGKSDKELAAMAAEKFKFPVTANNVFTARKTLGVNLDRADVSVAEFDALKRDVDNLAQGTKENAEELRKLADIVKTIRSFGTEGD